MKNNFRLGVVFTHPTQHHAPLWRQLNAQNGISVSAFYLCTENQTQGAKGEGNTAAWDVDLTSGYTYEYLKNWNGRISPKIQRSILTPELVSRINNEALDAVFVSSFYTYAYRLAVVLCKLRGIPLIMQNDSTIITDSHFSYLRKLSTALLYPAMYSLVDYWISSGDHNEIYLRHYGIGVDKIVRGCYPVDRERYEQTLAASSSDIDSIRQELSWDGETILYGFVGKYIDRKNPFEFIEAIVQAHRQDSRVRGIMLGGGPLDETINQRLAKLNGEVLNVGFINQSRLPLYYAALDVFVASSWSDPHPLVVSEAMACGCPPIISDRCGNWGYSDTVRHRYNGLVYPCGSSDALTQAILTLTDETTRMLYSQRSHQVFEQQDLNCEVNAFLKVFDRIKANSAAVDAAPLTSAKSVR